MNKYIRYTIFFAVIAFVAYNSVYFKKLDEVKAGTASFNASKYAANFWDKKLTPALTKSIEIRRMSSTEG